jgi:hypothetical protein
VEIGIPDLAGLVVGVAYVMAEDRSLSALFTDSGHGAPSSSVIFASEKTGKQINPSSPKNFISSD